MPQIWRLKTFEICRLTIPKFVCKRHSLFIQSFYHQQLNHLIYKVLESKAPDFSCSQVQPAIDHHAMDYASILSFLHTYVFVSQLSQSIFYGCSKLLLQFMSKKWVGKDFKIDKSGILRLW